MCIRQLMSVAITASAPVSSMHSSLRSSMAPDTSLIFTAKRPPNPQQGLGVAQRTHVHVFDRVQQLVRLAVDVQPAQAVTARWHVALPLKQAPQSVRFSTSTRNRVNCTCGRPTRVPAWHTVPDRRAATARDE